MFLTEGELAQLARAFEWHSKGRRFDSDILHERGDVFDIAPFFLTCTGKLIEK